jgi:hypothetical protein
MKTKIELSHKQARIARKRFAKTKRQEFTITPAFIASLPVGEVQEVSR